MRRTFPRQMDSLQAIVAYVREFVARECPAGEAAPDLDLVLEELFTNMVRHGRGGDVEIALERGSGGVVAELREHGAQPFDPTALPELDAESPLPRRRPGGLGLHLVRRLTTAFRYEYRDGVGVTRVVLREPR